MDRNSAHYWMTSGVGKKCIIIDNLEDHIGYNGEELTIVDVWPDGYYIVEGTTTHIVDENEIQIINR